MIRLETDQLSTRCSNPCRKLNDHYFQLENFVSEVQKYTATLSWLSLDTVVAFSCSVGRLSVVTCFPKLTCDSFDCHTTKNIGPSVLYPNTLTKWDAPKNFK